MNTSYYWTSTQYSSNNAWVLGWGDGLVGSNYKYGGSSVRAVCAF